LQQTESRLRALRVSSGQSLRAAARAIGVSDTYLSAVERGAVPPSEMCCRRLANVYGVEIDDLFAIAGIVPSEMRAWISGDAARLSQIRRLMEEPMTGHPGRGRRRGGGGRSGPEAGRVVSNALRPRARRASVSSSAPAVPAGSSRAASPAPSSSFVSPVRSRAEGPASRARRRRARRRRCQGALRGAG
jgi:transcriptional regulator with XRE-family HTH domain